MTLLALPLFDHHLCDHFAQAKRFALVGLDARGQPQSPTFHNPPEHAPGVLPTWLAELGVTTVIAGGIGRSAVARLQHQGIAVVSGVPSLPVATVVSEYVAGNLPIGLVSCTHIGGGHTCRYH